tara:strand:+ start:2335 stop:2679 length:345 start_codon:yes stop_codon:yes gene_type:complete
MSITKILADKNLTADEKLDEVADIVAGARDSYGNSDADIPEVKVNTTHGNLPFAHLESESKVEILMNEALNIKAEAISAVENYPGVVLNKKVQELLATNVFFVNVSSGTKFEYL